MKLVYRGAYWHEGDVFHVLTKPEHSDMHDYDLRKFAATKGPVVGLRPEQITVSDRIPTRRPESTRHVLMRARALIRRGWCQNDNAQDNRGLPTSPWWHTACKWCPSGALEAVCGAFQNWSFWNALSLLDSASVLDVPAVGDVTEANDDCDTTKDLVLSWFDTALKECD